MINEKDTLLREIQRLTLLLKTLISKVVDIEPNDIDVAVEETDTVLKSTFDLSLNAISIMPNDDFKSVIKDLNEEHVERLTELIFEVLKKAKQMDKTTGFNTIELIKKNILLINFLDENSDTFSMERMAMKNVLQQGL
ncbi:hypothetical protein [Algibacter lectus]|uniref:Uncharacterized protein n=1 Tax=Algibacter lectus TaxID=221126 RepID=A0A4R8MFY6_9FLAO|nr:hypothetical protein [Algibacter lectus]MWW23916.1 hypothetical protein [Algibacter lectus]TDY63397.1 hypothetical protein DFQ06_0274 [Algibacter lectus]SFC49398.1 hypothetical protein SAMN04489722_102550 [Algibacter lectus]